MLHVCRDANSVHSGTGGVEHDVKILHEGRAKYKVVHVIEVLSHHAQVACSMACDLVDVIKEKALWRNLIDDPLSAISMLTRERELERWH